MVGFDKRTGSNGLCTVNGHQLLKPGQTRKEDERYKML